jgi:hypothetical protein
LNDCDLDDLEDEKKFQGIVEEYRLKTKAKISRNSKIVESVARWRAIHLIEQE